MSTSEELQEQPPEPIEIIQSFLGVNQDYIEALALAHSSPTFMTIAEAETRGLVARNFVGAFHDRQFFKDFGEEDMSAAIDSIIVAVKELAQKSHEINANQPQGATFASDFKDETIRTLMDSERTEEASGQLCNIYTGFVVEASNALLSSDNVTSFSIKIGERHQKREQLKHYGGTALAAFAGVSLALWYQKRR